MRCTPQHRPRLAGRHPRARHLEPPAPTASLRSAPLRAISFLRQARENVIRPVAKTAEAVREIPGYELSFYRGGGIVDVRAALAGAAAADTAAPIDP